MKKNTDFENMQDYYKVLDLGVTEITGHMATTKREAFNKVPFLKRLLKKQRPYPILFQQADKGTITCYWAEPKTGLPLAKVLKVYYTKNNTRLELTFKTSD